MNQRLEIGKLVIGLAEYFEKQLTPTQIDMYVEDLLDVPPDDLLRAIRLYRKDSKNDRFPLPARLRSMLGATDDQNAREAVSRIISAISRIGPYRTDDACEYIGELGWEVVKRQGGWQSIVTLSGEAELSILQAQWRELAISLMSRNRAGIMNEAPRLPNSPSKVPQLENVNRQIVDDTPQASIEDVRKYLRPMQKVPTEDVKLSEKEIQDRVKFLKAQAEALEKNNEERKKILAE